MRRNKGRVTSDVGNGIGLGGISDGDYFIISRGSHLVRRVIHFTGRKAKVIVFTANNSPCFECHAAPNILLCFGQVALTIILS